MKPVLGRQGGWTPQEGGHTCLAADEEMAFLSSRSSSSARAEGVTGLAPPKERKKHVTSLCQHMHSRLFKIKARDSAGLKSPPRNDSNRPTGLHVIYYFVFQARTHFCD